MARARARHGTENTIRIVGTIGGLLGWHVFSVKEEVTQVAIACHRLALFKVIFPSKVVVLPSLDTDSASSPLSTLLSSAATLSSPSSIIRHTNSTPSPLTRRSGVPCHVWTVPMIEETRCTPLLAKSKAMQVRMLRCKMWSRWLASSASASKPCLDSHAII